MASDLVSNITSDYIGATKYIRPKDNPEIIIVYVEGFEDITFWDKIFQKYNNDKFKFDIKLPVFDGKIGTGKKDVPKFKQNVGRNLLLCVDSDYDYVLNNLNENAITINSNDFIFQTYVYSIENFICNENDLIQIVKETTFKNAIDIDFGKILIDLSEMIFELLVTNIIYQKNAPTKFTIDELERLITNISMKKDKNTASYLSEINQNFKLKINEKQEFKNEFNDFVLKLKNLQFSKQNIYLLLKGHTYYHIIEKFILIPIIYEITTNEVASLKIKANDGNKYKEYKNKVEGKDLKTLMLNKINNTQNPFYQKIETDVEKYIQINFKNPK